MKRETRFTFTAEELLRILQDAVGEPLRDNVDYAVLDESGAFVGQISLVLEEK